MVNADALWIYKIYNMKYPDISIQIKYPNKLINADTPKETKASVRPAETSWD